jgi:type IV secretory pathway VirB4 component
VNKFFEILLGTNNNKSDDNMTAKDIDRKRLQKTKPVKSKGISKRVVPKTALQTIPYLRICNDNTMEVKTGVYSRTYEFEDVNYKQARQEIQEDIFLRYCSILNSFDTAVTVQETILNNKINNSDFKDYVLLKEKNDDFDVYRNEYNAMLLDKVSEGQNDIKRYRYLTVTLHADSESIAKNKFNSMETELITSYKKLSSKLVELTSNDRLRIIKDIFRGVQASRPPELTQKDFKMGVDKLYICPDYFEFKNDYFMYDDKYARCLYVKAFPSYLSDRLLSELTEAGINMITTKNILPVDPSHALKQVKRRITAMKTNKLQAERKAREAGYTSELISPDLEFSLNEANELLDDLRNKNQKMFLVNCIIMHIADSYEQLTSDTEVLKSTARRFLCEIGVLKFQQEDAMASALPIGNNKLDIVRTLTTESTAILMPFNAKDLMQKNGMYYGLNAISKNMIMFNRKHLKNPNGFLLGTPGSGKSFAAKREMVNVLLNTDDDIIIIDPEREYPGLGLSFKGELIKISAGSKNIINPLDMSKDYADDEDPIVLKSEFILSLCECLIGGQYGLTSTDKGIIDRCVHIIYKEYVKDFDVSKTPTLKDFYAALLKQQEPEAKNLALSLEIYITGSLSIFANQTNIENINNRFVVFDIKDLGKQLVTMGMLIVLDYIWNRITSNRAKGKNTWIYIDEIYLLFRNEYSANFLFELYKRARKWGGIPTGITQNVEDLLMSELARRMLSNSDYVMMLNQAPSDRAILAKLLNISENELIYITNSDPGQGLISYSGIGLIPFIDKFPKDTQLYKLMSTNFNEIKAG